MGAYSNMISTNYLCEVSSTHSDCVRGYSWYSGCYVGLLPWLQEATNILEKRLKQVSSLCEERRALNEKERVVAQSEL